MDDRQILRLYWMRSESAIHETSAKYGHYCHTIADRILYSCESSEECVNDTWLGRGMPSRPNGRKSGVSIWEKSHEIWRLTGGKSRAQKSVAVVRRILALDELDGYRPAADDADQMNDKLVFAEILNQFLASFPTQSRIIFMRSYWYFSSIKEIAKDYGISKSKVKMTLLRARQRLKTTLKMESIPL